MRFRKKPVIIEAHQLTDVFGSDSWYDLDQFTDGLVKFGNGSYFVYDRLHDTWVEFWVGDWVIMGVQGEFYPIKNDVLAQTYEEV